MDHRHNIIYYMSMEWTNMKLSLSKEVINLKVEVDKY